MAASVPRHGTTGLTEPRECDVDDEHELLILWQHLDPERRHMLLDTARTLVD